MSSNPPVPVIGFSDHSYRLTTGCFRKARDQLVPNYLYYGFPADYHDEDTDTIETHMLGITKYGLASRRTVHSNPDSRLPELPRNYKRVAMMVNVVVPKHPLEHIEEAAKAKGKEMNEYFDSYAEVVKGACVEPVSLLLIGEAGTGKTSVIERWSRYFTNRGLTKVQHSPDSEFMDALVSPEPDQRKEINMVFIDEVFMRAEKAEKDLSMLMRLYNPQGNLKVTNPNKLQGRANIQIIMMTTNNSPDTTGFDAGAINRRIDFTAQLRTDGMFHVCGLPLMDSCDLLKLVTTKYVKKVKSAAARQARIAAHVGEC